jgi:two-component sensor histidine kinase
VRISTNADAGTVYLSWSESEGPLVDGPPTRQGFGTKLSELSIVQQLGGSIKREWRPEGLLVEVAVLEERLVR